MMQSMNSFRLLSLTIVVFIGIFLNCNAVQAQFDYSHIIAVDATVNCGGDGQTWANAYKSLGIALIVAEALPQIDEIWVAAGTYYPDENCANPGGTGDWNATFNMIDGVAILGGFNGTETVAEDRDPVKPSSPATWTQAAELVLAMKSTQLPVVMILFVATSSARSNRTVVQ